MTARLASGILTVLIPPLLLLLAVRLVMTPLFLQIEYQRPGFPADAYGMTTAQRLDYAPLLVDYLISGLPTRVLTDLTGPEGGVLFNVREVSHLRDVQTVAQWAFRLGMLAGAGALISALYLLRKHPNRLAAALRAGALLAIGLVVAVAVSAVVAWDFFFTAFHQLFFAGGTWVFAYSDSLIRLFPEQFWFDAALTAGGVTIVSALTLLLAAHLLNRVKPA